MDNNIKIEGSNFINYSDSLGSYNKLKDMCLKKADELYNELDFSNEKKIELSFWTDGIPELICIVKFEQKKNGNVVYDIDFDSGTI